MAGQPQKGGAVILAVIASACGGVVQRLGPELVGPATARGWSVAVTLTPSAGTWFSAADALKPLQALTDLPVRSTSRLPTEPKPYPVPDAFVCCPASANTIAKIALGIADNQALTSAREGIGTGRPFLLVPSVDAAQAAHPAYPGHLATLRGAGVRIEKSADWSAALDEL